MDDVEVIPVVQRTRPWSKALAVRRTEVAPASPQKSDNAVTSHIAVGKEASKRYAQCTQKGLMPSTHYTWHWPLGTAHHFTVL